MVVITFLGAGETQAQQTPPVDISSSFAEAEPLRSLPDHLTRPTFTSPPTISLSDPGEVLLGQDVSFTVTFDNQDPNDVGYGPILDVILDTTGADADAGGLPYDGLGTTSITASYLGIDFTTAGPDPTMWIIPFDPSGEATHPLMRDLNGTYITVNGTPGDSLVVLRLPFGSFSPQQPPAVVGMTVNMSNFADLGTPLSIQARGGYEFGYTPLDDWCCGDPGNATLSSFTSASATPTLLTLAKTYSGPEGGDPETVTGPNFRTFYPLRYTVTATIAPGQSVTSLQLQDTVPGNMQFFNLISSSPAGASCTTPGTSPGGTIQCDFPGSVSGSASFTFDFYIPLEDAGSSRVIVPSTGDDVTSCNQASLSASWTPLDPRDTGGSFPVNPSGCEHELNDKSIAIQKGSSDLNGGEILPGDIFEHTLTFQVSDFFAFNGVVITDDVLDGLHVVDTFTPTLELQGNPFSLAETDMLTSPVRTFDIECDYSIPAGGGPECTIDSTSLPNSGTTTLTFRVSQEIIERGFQAQGWLIGGCVDPAGGSTDPDCDTGNSGGYNDGPTYGIIRYRTRVLDNFTDDYPSGDESVDQGDVLGNDVDILGNVLDTTDLVTSVDTEDDDSSAGDMVGTGTLEKHIYSLNGNTTLPDPVEVKPGDVVTYQIIYTLPTSNEENLEFTDYLPLPVFHVDDPDEDGILIPPDDPWSFLPVVDATSPTAGQVKFGASDTFYQYTCDPGGEPAGCLVPTLSIDPTNNSLNIYYGDFNDPRDLSRRIELLFSITVSDDPFADRLYLTNQVHSSEGSTNAGTQPGDEIIQIVLTEPVLTSTKGVIWTSNSNNAFTPTPIGPVTFLDPTQEPRWNVAFDSSDLAANPIDSNVSGVDAGDIVSFAIVIENSGSSLNGAFDLIIQDDLPTQFQIPSSGLNLDIYYADRTGDPLSPTDPIPFNGLGGGSVPDPADDLFFNGIELIDRGGVGICQTELVGPGKNIILITFDLQLRDDVVPGTVINTESLLNYAGSEGGPNHLPEPQTDTAETTILPGMSKDPVSTEIIDTYNADDEAVIGELVYYTLTYDIPEGQMPNTQIVDTMNPGLAFVEITDVTVVEDIPGSVTFTAIDTGTSPSNPSVGDAGGGTGNELVYTLGTVQNDEQDDDLESIIVEYTAVVVNTIGNQAGTPLDNLASLTWTGGSFPAVSAPTVTVIEPVISVTKTVEVNGAGSIGDAGDSVEYTITLRNSGPVDAFDLTFEDDLPQAAGGQSLIVGPSFGFTVVDSIGAVDASDFEMVGSDAAGWTLQTLPGTTFDMLVDPARSITISITGTISILVEPGVFTNTATARWTSLDEVPVTYPRSIHNPNSLERTGAGGVNDYRRDASASVTVISAPTKTLVSTSEAHTGDVSGERVAIGEIVRYHLYASLPEGTSTNFQFVDILPDGLRFLDDGTTRVAFVCTGGGNCITSSTLSGAGLVVDGNDPNITPTFLLPGSAIAPGAFVDGTDPIFSLGNLVNSNDDGDSEYVVLEFNALVDNITGNQAIDNATGTISGTPLPNNYQVWVSGAQVGNPSADLVVNVAEPYLTIVKAATTIPSDAGDIAIFTLTYTNVNYGNDAAAAFEVQLSDTFDSNYLVTNAVTTPLAGTCGNTNAVASVSRVGNSVTAGASCMNPGDQVVVTVTASVVNDVLSGDSIPNQVDLQYTSLPGSGTPNGSPGNDTGSSTPGPDGSETGERNGTGGQGTDASTLNNYARTANLDVQIDLPAVVKLAPSPTQYTIGETVTFVLRVTLTEGETQNLRVGDILPVGLGYQSHTVITTAAGSGGDLVADYNGNLTTTPACPACVIGASGSLEFDFGTTQTDGSGPVDGTSNNQFLVQITALVLNVGSNQNGVDLTNIANLTYTDPEDGDTTLPGGSQDITIIEPDLQIGKVADDDTPPFGYRITYTLTISHTGSSASDGFDLAFSDQVPIGPPDFSYVNGSFQFIGPGVPPDSIGDTMGGALTATWDSFPGGSVTTLQYQVDLADESVVTLGDTFTNTANLTWTSLSGPSSDERDGSGGVNDYNTSTPETVTVTGPDMSISKDDGGVTGTPGNVVVYTLTFSNIGNGTATGVLITEQVPPNTTFAGPPDSTPGWSCSDGDPAGTNCTFTPSIGFGSGVVPASAVSSVNFAVRLDNPMPAGIDQISNTATVSDDGTNGTDPTPGNNQDSDTTPVNAAPDLVILKDDGVDTVSPGTVLIFALSISNVGDQDATGVEITDVVPANTRFNSGASNPGWSCDDPDGPGPLNVGDPGSTCTFTPDITFGSGNLPAGEAGVVNFALTVNSPFPVGVDQVTNTASIADDGSNGPDQNPGDNQDSDTDNVVTLGNVDLEKLLIGTSQTFSTDPEVGIGEILTYQIQATLPTGTITGTTITDILDTGLAFVRCVDIRAVPGNLTTTLPGGFGAACDASGGNPAVLAEPPGNTDLVNEGRRVVFDLQGLTNPDPTDETLIIEYEVVVLDNAGNQRGGSLNNSVLWNWDSGSLSEQASEVTIIEPTLTFEKTVDSRIALPGEVITFTLSVAQDPSSDSDAFDLLITDVLPDELEYVTGSLRWTNVGLGPSLLDDTSPPTLRVIWDNFSLGSTSEIEFQAELGNVRPGSLTINTARLEWTSLPDDGVLAPRSLSPYNFFATERYYDPGDPVNIYGLEVSVSVRVPELPETGFSPGIVTEIPLQPRDLAYFDLPGFQIEIPSLEVNLPVVGVPRDDVGWNLTWLYADAGFLEGTAFPTLPGNTAITAHVVLPDGNPGPFAELAELSWGDEVLIHTGVEQYRYEIREVRHVLPNDLSVLGHEEYDWLTLITCESFDPNSESYLRRVVVRAVLVEVTAP